MHRVRILSALFMLNSMLDIFKQFCLFFQYLRRSDFIQNYISMKTFIINLNSYSTSMTFRAVSFSYFVGSNGVFDIFNFIVVSFASAQKID